MRRLWRGVANGWGLPALAFSTAMFVALTNAAARGQDKFIGNALLGFVILAALGVMGLAVVLGVGLVLTLPFLIGIALLRKRGAFLENATILFGLALSISIASILSGVLVLGCWYLVGGSLKDRATVILAIPTFAITVCLWLKLIDPIANATNKWLRRRQALQAVRLKTRTTSR